MNINGAARRLRLSLPREVREKASASVRNAESMRWDSGELSLELVDELPVDVETGMPYSKTAIRMCVASMYDAREGTIRSREYVCRNVSKSMRSNYPFMTYEYWRSCCGAKPEGDQSKEDAILYIADQVWAYYDAYDEMPSVDTVRSWVGEGDVKLVYIKRTEGIIATCDKIIEDKRTPSELREFLSVVSGVLVDFLESGEILPLMHD